MPKGKPLALRKALDLLRLPGHRLMRISDGNASMSWFVVPGGFVLPETAAEIIKRPDVCGCEDGLFPGYSQTFQIGGRP